MACLMGGQHGRKRGFRSSKSYGIGRKAAGTAAPSVGRKKLPAGRKGTFDGRNRLSKVLLRYFRESNKAYAPYPALVTLKQGERTAY